MVSKFLFQASARFKAELSLEEFSSALADAVAGNLSQLVLAFEPSGDFGTFGDFAERRVLEEGVDSPAEASTPKRRRSINPSGRNSDPTVYKLQNLDGRTASGTQAKLKRKLGMSQAKFHKLLNAPGASPARAGIGRRPARRAQGRRSDRHAAHDAEEPEFAEEGVRPGGGAAHPAAPL